MDERLIDHTKPDKIEDQLLKFDSKGILAIERMKNMNVFFKEKDKTIQSLTETKQFLIDSKTNVNYK